MIDYRGKNWKRFLPLFLCKIEDEWCNINENNTILLECGELA